MVRSSVIGLVVASITTSALAQAPAARPTFVVVSIKMASPDARVSGWGFRPGGLFHATSVTVRNLIATAFLNPGPPPIALLPNQIVGGPSWMGIDRFDVEGKVDEALAKTNVNLIGPPGTLLVRSLLEDRFKLATHMETRNLPVFVLTLAKSDGTLGPKLKHSTVDCQAQAQARERDRLSGATLAAPVPGVTPCLPKSSPGLLQGTGIQMMSIVVVLRAGLGGGVEVVDRTGITGPVDVDFHFTVQSGGLSADNPSAGSLPEGDSVFTAAQDQLGLKLEGRREPRPVLVVEHLEHPTGD